MNKQRLLMMIEVAIFAAIGFILDKSLRQVEQRFVQYKRQ